MSRQQGKKAQEVAMRRRKGASPEHSEKVKSHMLCQADLHTTCQKCKKRIVGTLDYINEHVGGCDGHSTGK